MFGSNDVLLPDVLFWVHRVVLFGLKLLEVNVLPDVLCCCIWCEWWWLKALLIPWPWTVAKFFFVVQRKTLKKEEKKKNPMNIFNEIPLLNISDLNTLAKKQKKIGVSIVVVIHTFFSAGWNKYCLNRKHEKKRLVNHLINIFLLNHCLYFDWILSILWLTEDLIFLQTLFIN